jgi:uncharacterized protein YutE (UPF0331/DUF86 family)
MIGIDIERVKERAREIRESLEKIRRYAALPNAEFFADERNLYTVMHLLLTAIEATTSLCAHILAKTARKAPSSHAECFEGLRDLGVVDDELASRLVKMVRFRNLLVHRYWEVDPVRVLGYAREDLGDFEDFLAAIESFARQEM